MSENVNAPAKTEGATTINEMANFLKSNKSENVVVKNMDESPDSSNDSPVEVAETEETATPDGDEGQVAADDAGETSEVEAKADDQDDSKDGSATEQAKKPSQRAKLRARLEETEKLVQHVHDERNQAVYVANEWRAAAQEWKARYEKLVAQAKEQYGHTEDPRELELMAAKQKLAAVERQQAQAKQSQQQQIKQHIATRVNTMKNEFTEQAIAASQKFPGIEPAQILTAFHAATQAGMQVEIGDVARQLASLAAVSKNRQRHEATRQHLETSNKAPRPINGRGGKRPDYDATIEGMDAYLKSLKG